MHFHPRKGCEKLQKNCGMCPICNDIGWRAYKTRLSCVASRGPLVKIGHYMVTPNNTSRTVIGWMHTGGTTELAVDIRK
jgi:hypothetical protein